jgi:hypothetical protein
MKNLILVFSLVLSTAVFAGNNDPVNGDATATAENSNGNGKGIGAAMSAIRKTCPNATGELQYSETVVSSCFAGGFITQVYFYRVPNCPPNMFCIQVIEEIGTVLLDCEGDVISVSCSAPFPI